MKQLKLFVYVKKRIIHIVHRGRKDNRGSSLFTEPSFKSVSLYRCVLIISDAVSARIRSRTY